MINAVMVKVKSIFKANELVLETMFQLTLQLIMLFINNTETPVEKGLSNFFSDSDDNKYKQKLLVFVQSVISPSTVLALSSVWSVKTVITTTLGLVGMKKVGVTTVYDLYLTIDDL